MEWCDDERNTKVFLKYEPAEPFIPNIYKDVLDHLKKTAEDSVVNEIKYCVYEYEPLNIAEDDDLLPCDDGSEFDDEFNGDLLDTECFAYT